MKQGLLISTALALAVALAACSAETATSQTGAPQPADDTVQARQPNIIIVYADDLGYGDLGSYGATGLPTPYLDDMAAEGVRFTDAHASAATCTPSRYSLLTGEYGFRSQAEILPGDAPLLIRPGKATIASVLADAGYATGVVGKWHLGLGNGDVDWNGEIGPGPLDIGFDYSFLLPATGDRVPTVFVENRKVVGLDPDDPITVDYNERIGNRPVGTESPELLKQQADLQHSNTIVNGISRIGYMAGGVSAEWIDEDFPDIFTGKAIEFIRAHQEEPFFLFYSYHDPHVPRVPNPRFKGVSGQGPRGDAIVQLDWMTGQIVEELETLGIAEDTLVIFTSDNGPVLDDGYADRAVELLGDHKPWGPLRGGKYSAYEAGARVPMISWWPGKIDPGQNDALISQVDYMASLVTLAGAELQDDAAIDSRNLLPVILGQSEEGRDILFKESVGTVSLRKGDLKYIAPMPADARIPDWLPAKDIEGGLQPTPQLYDLSADLGEQANIASTNEDLVAEMERYLAAIRTRTTAEER